MVPLILGSQSQQYRSIIWQKCLGGSDGEDAYTIRQIANEGYAVTVITESNNGDVHRKSWLPDAWLVENQYYWTIIWQHCYGGFDEDAFHGCN
jgi:hypothetical protein